MEEKFITVQAIAEKLNLENLTPEIDLSKIPVKRASVHRPAFQFAGYFEFVDRLRVQVVGYAETEFIKRKSPEERAEIYDKLFEVGFPAVVIARHIPPEKSFIAAARKYNVPVLTTPEETYHIITKLIHLIDGALAPTDTMHGVLINVYGEGIIIRGRSGIGKSETALELVKRGHRLVSDDVIEITNSEDKYLIGNSPEITKHLIELRGIGIIDVKSLFGVQSILESTRVDMIIDLEEWEAGKEYDRLGLEDSYENVLGLDIVRHTVPIGPGRNLAIIVETAAINNRQKKMGYNAAQKLCERMSQEIDRKSEKNRNETK